MTHKVLDYWERAKREAFLIAPKVPWPVHRMTDAEMAVLGEQDNCKEMALERTPEKRD